MTKHEHFVDLVVGGTTTIITRLLGRLFGPGIKQSVLGPYSWADLCVLVFIALLVATVHAVVAVIIKRKRRTTGDPPDAARPRERFLAAISKPIYLFIWICGAYIAAKSLVWKLPVDDDTAAVYHVFDRLFDFAFLVALIWMFVRLTRVLELRLTTWTTDTSNRLDHLITVLLVRCLRIIVPVVGIIFALPMAGLPAEYANIVGKGSSILIIVSIAWILFQCVHLGEESVLAKYDLKAADNLRARKLFTQVHFLSRALYVIILIFTLASVLMLFEEIRRFGTSILASAGVIGIVAGLAAQHTIGNLIAGLQLAVTQPMRIDDVLIVEGEWGRVEEISFTYVVLNLWDERRLIIPLSYFIEKPFQNWTRVSASLMGSVLLWIDYTLPVTELRRSAQQIVEASALWDRRFWNLQVSDANERAMQIRILATATDSSKAWDLRCEIREKMIEYIQTHYPNQLTRTRVDLTSRST